MSKMALPRAALSRCARSFCCAFCGALAMACPPHIARAQAQHHDAGDATLPPITVTGMAHVPQGPLDLDSPQGTGSRLGLTARETPASVTQVERAAIEARGAQDTQEILRAIPGVTAHSAPGSIGVSYRGFGGGSVSQLFNGIHVQYAIAARPVDSWIYERVEAIGGPSSFLFGAGAVGGTINVITKLAQPQDITEFRVRLGSHGLKEASVGLNRQVAGTSGDGHGVGDHHLRLDLNHRDADGWTEGTHTRATQLATSLLSHLGGTLRHTLAYEFQHERVDRPYWGTPLRQPLQGTLSVHRGLRDKNYNSADGLYEQQVQWARSILSGVMGPALSWQNTFYVYDAQRDYRNVESYRLTADNSAVIRSSAYLQRHEHRVLGDRLEGQYQGTLAGRPTDWSFGVEVSTNRQTRFPSSVAGPISTVDPYHFQTEHFFDIAGMSPRWRADRDNQVDSLAAYVENRSALGPRLHLLSGLRHEQIELSLRNRREVNAANPASYQRRYRPSTGRLGLVWDIHPDAMLYAQYATAADPPSGVLSTASFADVRNNSELTKGQQFELGSKLEFWQGKGSATLAAYRITRRHIATQDPANSSLTLLVGEQSAQGVELAVGLQPSPRWSLRGHVSHVDARYEAFRQAGVSLAGKTPSNTPSTVADLWLTHSFTPAWQASLGVRHVSGVYADAANTLRWPSYTLLDVGMQYRLSQRACLDLRVRNVTDQVYAAQLSATSAYLGAPRTADLSLRLTF